MISRKRLHFILVFFAAFFLASSMFVGTALTNPLFHEVNGNERMTNFTPSSILIDGTLSAGEWSAAEHKIRWYMDADPENSDGYNYMYIDEDQDYLYIALDLCSDQTNDETGEWIGLWLNTNETYTNSSLIAPWEAALNDGLESLVFDVDNGIEMPFFNPNGNLMGEQFQLQSFDVLTPKNGSLTGTLADLLGYMDGLSANMTSDFNGTHYIYRLDVEIDIAEYHYDFGEVRAPFTTSVQLGGRTQSNVTLDEHYLSIRDSLGNLNLTDPSRTISINTGTSWIDEYLKALSGNFTVDDIALFSFVGINSVPFKTSFDRIRIGTMFSNSTNTPGTNYVIDRPYTSLASYEIDWSFGPSENNASDHRSFEIKIPKSELEGYKSDNDLGVLVGGYGTLIAWPNTHNWVLQNGTHTGILYQNTTAYYYYSMSSQGATTTTTTTSTITTTSTTTSTTGTTTPPPSFGDITQILLIAGGVGAVVVIIIAIFALKKR